MFSWISVPCNGDMVTPWTPYRGPTKKPPFFTVKDLIALPDGELVGKEYIRRCRLCDMPRLFLALRRK